MSQRIEAMADIVISYAREDAAIAVELAAQIERLGLSVWWDRSLVVGENFHAAIESEITRSKRVIVLWSKDSISSRWVLSEAEEASHQQKLVPIRVGDIKIPLGFRTFHSIELNDARGRLREILTGLKLLSAAAATAPRATVTNVPETRASEDSAPPCLECDTLAADPRDPTRVAEGVGWPDLDVPRVLVACRAAIEQFPGTARFEYQLARAHLQSNDYHAALPWLEAAADKGHREALVCLGSLYMFGHFGLGRGRKVPIDIAKGLECWERAAALGATTAMTNLAFVLREGELVRRDEKKALEWVIKAADLGDLDAAAKLADYYANGYGTPVNFQEALAWYQKALSGGETVLSSRSGPAFKGGYGHPVDRDFEIAFLTLLAEHGDTRAMDDLAKLTGDDAWYRRSLKALEAKATNGDAQASCDLGFKYQIGTGVSQDSQKARHWYERAAARGHVRAARYLSKLLLDSREERVDYDEAVRWLKVAIERHDSESCVLLAQLYAVGVGVEPNAATAVDYFFKALEQDDYFSQSAFLMGLNSTFWISGKEYKWGEDFSRDVQKKLKDRGLYAGPINARFDAAFVEGVRRLLEGQDPAP